MYVDPEGPGIGVIEGCWPLCRWWDSNPAPLEEQPGLLTTEPPLEPMWNDPSVRSGKLVTELNQYEQAHTYSMIMSLEVLALSANSWQLTTLKPYPSQAYPLISMVCTWTSSCPVFSTLNVLFNVKFGSLSFKPERKSDGRINHLLLVWRGICCELLYAEHYESTPHAKKFSIPQVLSGNIPLWSILFIINRFHSFILSW